LRSFSQRLWDGGEDLIERWRDEEPPVDERRSRSRSRDWDDPDDGEDPWI
jgi:hypothetical protein